MMPAIRVLALSAALILGVGACAGPRGGPGPGPGGPNASVRPLTEQDQNIRLMLSYDENSDGIVTRDEMEAGLRRQFAACDLNHDGRVDLQEMQAENARRFRAFGTGASPLMDWNQNGQLELDEFATTARSLFAELDRNMDGRLEGDEVGFSCLGGAGAALARREAQATVAGGARGRRGPDRLSLA